jgi:hypothetical protein
LLKDDSTVDPNHGKTISTDESDAADLDCTDESVSLGTKTKCLENHKNQKFVLKRLVLGRNPEGQTN